MHPFFKWIGFPIRKSADQFIFADPRGLSQLITSFIASESQGIPRVPFLTFFYHCRLLLGTVCFLIPVAFTSYLHTPQSLNSPLYCCLLFLLLLPICQRTFTPVFLLQIAFFIIPVLV